MLRSQGVPCKLVVGYAGKAYHACFASSGKSSEAIMKYIGDGSHYTAKYLY